MERGREIFFSSSVLKEEISPPALRYGITLTSEKGRGGNPIKENRFLISRSCLLSYSWLFGFSPSHFFFSFPSPSVFVSPWARSMEMRAMFPAPPRAQCPSRVRACVRACACACTSVTSIIVRSGALITSGAKNTSGPAIRRFLLFVVRARQSNRAISCVNGRTTRILKRAGNIRARRSRRRRA